ncbi:MAG: hypothetical protein RIC80_08380 [Cyclobacteriaceae bacterium]
MPHPQFTKISIFLFLLFPILLSAQDMVFLEDYGGADLQRDQQLPETLISSRSVVMINTGPEQLISGEWREKAIELHKFLVNVKVDPVAYFYWQDFKAGRTATANFTDMLNQRNIQNVILFDYFPDTAATDFAIKITSYDTEKSPFANGQSAWMIEGHELRDMVRILGQDILRADIPFQNFLIADFPEFFDDTQLLEKRRFPVYSTDIRIEKLAIPLFDSIEVKNPESIPQNIMREINAYNMKVASNNRELRQLMSTYPYKYDLVPYREDGRFYFSNGFQFLLMGVHARGKTLRKMLDYELSRNETHYISIHTVDGKPIAKKFPADQPVHKYYIQHTISGNVYLGDEWDAGATWQEGLRNYIDNNLAAAKR